MRWVAAPLAAALAALALAACGDGGAEPGASDEATLVLDFQPNAVHAGIYRPREGRLRRRRDRARDPRAVGVDRRAEAARVRPRRVRDPRHPRPRARPRARHRRGRGRGDRPAPAGRGDRRATAPRSAPRATSRAARSGSPGCPPTTPCSTRCSRPAAPTPSAVDRVTIGFDSVAALSAGRLDAATAFWNAEGVALRAPRRADARVPRRRLRRPAATRS